MHVLLALSVLLLLAGIGLWTWTGEWRYFAAPAIFAIIHLVNLLAARRRQ